ncbi:uncharacterized protein [Littorina saxatilis]|uniref:Uncharacterized protein n=1 Tax=Littorina saxatilis TaxID=31220 RepID=A0AAN9AR74_9CAEN
MFETHARTVIWGLSPTMLIVGSFYHVMSIATPHWLSNNTAHMGLWSYCSREDGTCVGITEMLNENDHASWFRAVQGLEIAATVFVLVAIVTGLMRANLGHTIWQTAAGVSAIVAGGIGVAGVTVFGKNYQDLPGQQLSWAYVFNAASSGLCLLSGPVLILDSILYK